MIYLRYFVNPENDLSPARRRWLYAAVAAAAGLGGAGLAWWRFSPKPVSEDAMTALWRLSFDTPTGGRLALQSLQGRPLLINFWATWCPPCIEELPLLDAFYKENAAKGWQILGLAVDKMAPVRDFLTKQPLTFPIALAGMEGVGLSKSLGNLSGGLPFTVVLGADGVVRDRKIGKVSSADLAHWRELQ
ncbi:MAG: TlpA family protein disulfide reductase [Burkholderiales bacterium]|nr:TlpA family protein disulfide reductase [Burkholderiales bacterium]